MFYSVLLANLRHWCWGKADPGHGGLSILLERGRTRVGSRSGAGLGHPEPPVPKTDTQEQHRVFPSPWIEHWAPQNPLLMQTWSTWAHWQHWSLPSLAFSCYWSPAVLWLLPGVTSGDSQGHRWKASLCPLDISHSLENLHPTINSFETTNFGQYSTWVFCCLVFFLFPFTTLLWSVHYCSSMLIVRHSLPKSSWEVCHSVTKAALSSFRRTGDTRLHMHSTRDLRNRPPSVCALYLSSCKSGNSGILNLLKLVFPLSVALVIHSQSFLPRKYFIEFIKALSEVKSQNFMGR